MDTRSGKIPAAGFLTGDTPHQSGRVGAVNARLLLFFVSENVRRTCVYGIQGRWNGNFGLGYAPVPPLSSAVKTDESVNLGSNPVAIPHGNSFLLYYFGFESEGRNAPRILFCRDFSGPDKRVRPVRSHLGADLHDAGEISVVADAPGRRALFVLDSWHESYPRMISVTYTDNQPYYDEGGDLPINGYKTVFRPTGDLDDPLGLSSISRESPTLSESTASRFSGVALRVGNGGR